MLNRILSTVLIQSFALSLIPGLAGCASRSHPGAATRASADPEPVSARSSVVLSNAETAQPRVAELPDGPLTLRHALALTLIHHPGLAAYSWPARLAEARRIQAELRPNPELGFEVENALGTDDHRGVREAETTLQLSQLIELGGKRAARYEAASLARELAAWDYEAQRLSVLSQTAESFLDVVMLQELLDLQEERVKLARDFVDAVNLRVEQARTPAVERTRARMALAAAEIELDQARRTLATARQRLSAQWKQAEPGFARAEGELAEMAEIPSLDSLRDQLRRNPRLARWATEMAERKASLRLEEARRLPDLTVSGGYRHLNGPDDHAFVAGISIPLPVFNRNQGRIEEAEYRLAQADDERRAAQWALSTALDQAWQRLSTATVKVTAIREKILPAAQEAFEQVNRFYEQGRYGYLEVLDTQRTFFSARRDYLEALGEYHRLLLDLEQLVGDPAAETGSILKTPQADPK